MLNRLVNLDDEQIIQWVDQLFHEALQKNISDIHIEPYLNHCRIRFRRDGLLYLHTHIPLTLFIRLVTRIKIMANLNIAEKRLPQDGRIKLYQQHTMDMRINTCPTLYGEKMVIRLQNTTQANLTISELGFTKSQQKIFLEKLAQPQGLIIVTGPTGSGKTITLYAALSHLNQIEKNISTVEDPVEIELPEINQVNINANIGLDFATMLRTLLRQDPDIIMIGEIRDQETARIATQAAQTGHLVLSTLHCQSTAEALLRLQSLSIAPEQLRSSLSLVITQRLIRKTCNPCERCHQGYLGRIGIFEFAELLNKEMPLQLVDPANMSLRGSGDLKVKNGVTDEKELRRVMGAYAN